ncbi:MAG TPA: MMPL family transporter [bacterium]|nr:MMPL family transporter [bacterium]
MEKIAVFVVRHRWPVLIAVLAVTGFFFWGMGELKVKTDFMASIDPEEPVVKLYDYMGETFGGNDVALVALEADDVFRRDVLGAMRGFSRKAETLAGVDSVLCLTEMMDIKKTEGGIEVGDLFDPGEPPDQKEIDALRGYILDKEMYTGIFVSPSGHMAVILVRLSGTGDVDRVALGQELRRMAEDGFADTGVKLYYAGLPFQIYYMDEIVLDDMGLLTPVVFGLVALVLGLFYRRLAGVFLPLAGVGFAVVWSLGLMGFTGTPISLLTGVLPVVLVAVGSAYAIHVVSRYVDERRQCDDRREATRRALFHVGLPVLFAGLTTVVGFGSLASANIQIIREMGLFAAFGVFGATVISLTLVPAVLAIIGGSVKRDFVNRMVEPGRISHATARFIEKHPRLISLGVLALFAAGVVALPYVRREVNLVEFFPEDSTMRASERVIEKHFGGSVPMQVYVQGDIRHPSVLKRMERIEKLMRSQVGHGAQSIGALLRELCFNLYDERRIPPTRDGVNELFYLIEGNDLLKNLVARGDYYPPEVTRRLAAFYPTPAPDDAQTDDGENLETEAVIVTNVSSSRTQEMIAHTQVLSAFLASDVPRLESPVTVADLGRTAFDVLRDYQLGWIAWGLSRDALYRGLDLSREEALLALREAGLGEPVSMDAETIAGTLTPWLENYVKNSGDVLLDDGPALERLGKTVAGVWRPGGDLYPDPAEISAAIEGALPESYLAEYPDDPDWLADIIAKRTTHNIQNGVVDRWTQKVLGRLPEPFSADAEFVSDLRGALFELTDRTAYVPSDMAWRLTGEPPKEIVPLLVTQSGFPRIFGVMEQKLVDNQKVSMAIAYVLVFFLLLAVMRNIVGGLLASIPILLTILINFAIMALWGIPLDFVTMMIASLVIGIGVDYTIHFTESFRRELGRSESPVAALERVLATTGRAVIINATSVAAGFLVLLASEIIPLRQFGVLVAVTMIASSLAALVILPAIYFTFRPKFIFNKGLKPLVPEKEKE